MLIIIWGSSKASAEWLWCYWSSSRRGVLSILKPFGRSFRRHDFLAVSLPSFPFPSLKSSNPLAFEQHYTICTCLAFSEDFFLERVILSLRSFNRATTETKCCEQSQAADILYTLGWSSHPPFFQVSFRQLATQFSGHVSGKQDLCSCATLRTRDCSTAHYLCARDTRCPSVREGGFGKVCPYHAIFAA